MLLCATQHLRECGEVLAANISYKDWKTMGLSVYTLKTLKLQNSLTQIAFLDDASPSSSDWSLIKIWLPAVVSAAQADLHSYPTFI